MLKYSSVHATVTSDDSLQLLDYLVAKCQTHLTWNRLKLPLVSGLSYNLRNISVFNARLNVCIDGSDVIAGGSMFQTLASATA